MLRISKTTWNNEYAQGKWEYLSDPIERARHAVIGMYCNHLLPDEAKILDAGCGEGILLDYLKPSLQRGYLGIDLSHEAIRIAKARRKGRFQVADVEKFNTAYKFDATIFNEVLYFVNEIKVFEKYLQFLTPAGYLIISLYHHKYDTPIWENIRRFYNLVGWAEITGESQGKKITWRIEVGRAAQKRAEGKKI